MLAGLVVSRANMSRKIPDVWEDALRCIAFVRGSVKLAKLMENRDATVKASAPATFRLLLVRIQSHYFVL